MSNETIEVCPECDSHDIYHRSPKFADLTDDDSEYYCMSCGGDFDTPDERERQLPGSVPSHSLASKLADPDVTSVDDLTEADP